MDDDDCSGQGAAVDTIVQLTNTSEFLTEVFCFYTNTNSHCSNSPETICTDVNFRDQCPPRRSLRAGLGGDRLPPDA